MFSTEWRPNAKPTSPKSGPSVTRNRPKSNPTADSDAANMLSDADAQAYKIRGEGEAQMMKSLEVLQQNPELADFNMQITALEQLLKEKATLILDQSTSPLNLLQPISRKTNAPAAKNP